MQEFQFSKYQYGYQIMTFQNHIVHFNQFHLLIHWMILNLSETDLKNEV